jgi:type II restriction/modification system DNA methylase subunit YeeA
MNTKILDPACGSGNFLYVSIRLLLDLEKEVVTYSANHGSSYFPHVEPTQLLGIEINQYAHELAHAVVWIGYLQWMIQNGFGYPDDPILKPFDNIKHMDAIIDLSDPINLKEPDWPEAEFIVGNPPFLGGSKLWEELGREYQKHLWKIFDGRIPGGADLCCYWFEKAREQIARKKTKRAGLLATQSIRGGVNREVLKKIKSTSDIFFALSDANWILDGANVHISMVGFGEGEQSTKQLDGNCVPFINSNLTATTDITQSKRLMSNTAKSFSGTKKSGLFNVPEPSAIEWLSLPNPHGKPNSDLLRPWLNGTAIVKRPERQWIIDTSVSISLAFFCHYERPYQHVFEYVKPDRDKNKREHRKENWWLHAETCSGMRAAIARFSRFIATPRVSKFRIFIWVDRIYLADDGIYVFASDDDSFFGILHSKLHEVWSLAQGTQVRERESGFRYTPTTCFETFPFPTPTEAQCEAIGQAAKKLDTLRNNWLNPPEWTKTEILEFPGSLDGPWSQYVHDAGANGIGTVRYPRLVPKDDTCAKSLKSRTLTNLYNKRPTWLDLAHKDLDAAVFAAYGWDTDMSDEEILTKLLELNLAAAT